MVLWTAFTNPYPLTSLPELLFSSVLYITTFLFVRYYTLYHTPFPIFRTIIIWNSRLYSLFCFTYSILLFTNSPSLFSSTWTNDDFATALRHIYHYTKLYEYIDVPLVLLTAATPTHQPIDLHFFIHHLTTPYYTYIRVLPNPTASHGWKLFAQLNKMHHTLMYAYFGGLWEKIGQQGRGRLVLQSTGILQLVLGIVGEVVFFGERRLWKRNVKGGEDWRNVGAAMILGIWLLLNVRDLRIKNSERGGQGQKRREGEREKGGLRENGGDLCFEHVM